MTQSPEQHLAAAKEAVAKKYGYPDWESLMFRAIVDGKEEYYCEESALLALTNQAKELEEQIEHHAGNALKNLNAVRKFQEEIEQLKSELSKSTEEKEQLRQSIGRTAEDYILQINRQKDHIKLLKEEKAKAFDEGAKEQRENFSFTMKGLVFDEIFNPYRDKANEGKQDLQKSTE